MVYSWRWFLLVILSLCMIAVTNAFTSPNQLRTLKTSPKISSRRHVITASLDDLEKRLLSASETTSAKSAPSSKAAVRSPKPAATVKQAPSPRPVPVKKPAPAPAPKASKATKVIKAQPPVKKAPSSAAAVSPSEIAAGVGLGVAPWIIAPVVALSAGRDILMKTKKAREVAQKKLEEERLAELAKAKAAEPVKFELEGAQATFFAAAVAAISVGVGGLFIQANFKPSEAPAAPAAPAVVKKAPEPAIPKSVAVVEKIREVKEAEKTIEKKVEAVETKVQKVIKKDLAEIEYKVEDTARSTEQKIEKAVVGTEKTVEMEIKSVEKVLEKAPAPVSIKPVAKVEPAKPAAPTPSASSAPAPAADAINPELLKSLKAGKYKTF